MYKAIKAEALQFADAERIESYKRYFKCLPGAYGYGDTFVGIKSPELRILAKKHRDISLTQLERLIQDKIHEIRLLALYILVLKYQNKKATPDDQKQWVSFYLKNLDCVNNWDLVDSSAQYVLGAWEFHHPSETLIQLATHPNMWYNRVAMIATFYYIRQNAFELPLRVAELLINNKNDIIHKAVGWMLREIATRNQPLALNFVREHYVTMSRTTLRYAIEKFDEPLRQACLKGTF
ncbi:MAG: DNA alkylation repair protein [Salinivirgaceae bacterium]